MEVKELISLIATINDRKGLYLLVALSQTAGFFSNNGTILFVVKDQFGYAAECVETDYLQLQTHVHINAVENHQTFNDGFYNIISYIGELENPNLDSFVRLCTVDANNEKELKYKEFFYSLITLFQLPNDQNYKNAVGLYGELKFMQFIKDTFDEDISTAWHRSGSFSKLDFAGKDTCLEIKTTSSDDECILIKHKQVFGEHSCFVGVVYCDHYDGGETIENVLEDMARERQSFSNINFNINLAKELKRISPKDVKELRFITRRISVFHADTINPFPIVPENVFELKYRLDVNDFDGECASAIYEMVQNLLGL